MHKNEASKLFSILGSDKRVKALKMLYNMGPLTNEQLEKILEENKKGLVEIIVPLLTNELIISQDDKYIANKSKIDELMSFIATPCKCCKD